MSLGSFLDSYSTSILIGVLTLFVALNGVVFEIKRHPDKPPGLRNMSTAGYLLLIVIVVLGIYTVYKQITDNRASEAENRALSDKLSKAQDQREDMTNVLTTVEGVQNVISVTTENINQVSNDVKAVTDKNQQILDRLQKDSELSIENQAAVLKVVRGLAAQVSDQQDLLAEFRQRLPQDTPVPVPEVSQNNYAKVLFEGLTTGENCEATPGNKGEFYYEFYANGKRLASPPYSLENPLMLRDNETKRGLGSIDGLRILGENDSITVSGYIRERDPKNFLGRWTYKYAGTFSEVLPARALASAKEITVVDKPDCQLTLSVNVSTYSQ